MLKLYENIRARRIALHMTQQELAKKLGYKSTSTIAKIESGENDIPQAKVAAFASALDTTPSALMGINVAAAALAVPGDMAIVAITKNKPLLKALIKRLDGLSEMRLKYVADIVNTVIDSYEAEEGIARGKQK